LLPIRKIIDNKMTLLCSKKWKNSSLAKKISFIGSATGYQDCSQICVMDVQNISFCLFIKIFQVEAEATATKNVII
jgi:hypothetical protein